MRPTPNGTGSKDANPKPPASSSRHERRIGTEPVGNDTARGARSHDHIVVASALSACRRQVLLNCHTTSPLNQKINRLCPTATEQADFHPLPGGAEGDRSRNRGAQRVKSHYARNSPHNQTMGVSMTRLSNGGVRRHCDCGPPHLRSRPRACRSTRDSSRYSLAAEEQLWLFNGRSFAGQNYGKLYTFDATRFTIHAAGAAFAAGAIDLVSSGAEGVLFAAAEGIPSTIIASLFPRSLHHGFNTTFLALDSRRSIRSRTSKGKTVAVNGLSTQRRAVA